MYSSRLEKTSNVIHLYICLQQSAMCSKEQQHRAWHKYTALPARAPHGHLLTCRHTLRSKKPIHMNSNNCLILMLGSDESDFVCGV